MRPDEKPFLNRWNSSHISRDWSYADLKLIVTRNSKPQPWDLRMMIEGNVEFSTNKNTHFLLLSVQLVQ